MHSVTRSWNSLGYQLTPNMQKMPGQIFPFIKMYDAQDDIFHVAATSVCVDNGVYKSGDGCETNLLVSCFVVQHKLKLFVRKDGGHIRCVFSEDEREEIRIRPSIYETFRRQRTL